VTGSGPSWQGQKLALRLIRLLPPKRVLRRRRQNLRQTPKPRKPSAHIRWPQQPIRRRHQSSNSSSCGDIARHKAETSARFAFPARAIEQRVYGKDLKGGTVPGLALVPGIIAFPGGLAVMTDDKVQIGGIGVSGGTGDQDESCAQAGIDAVKDALK
jgi:uncharacterized protein GlcG (DUF336 family)